MGKKLTHQSFKTLAILLLLVGVGTLLISSLTIKPGTSSVPASNLLPNKNSGLLPVAKLSGDWPDWFKGLPCKPPCWQGLIPGRTTEDEAVKLLQKNPLFGSVTLSPPTRDSSKRSGADISYNWHGQARINSDSGDIYFNGRFGFAFDSSIPDDVIIVIKPPDFPGGYTVGDLIRAYGNPSHISSGTGMVFGKGQIYLTELLYLSQGMIIEIESSYKKPTINSDTELKSVKFFEPGEAGIKRGAVSLNHFVAWQGFKDFDFYCAKAEYCVDYASRK